MTPFLRGAVLRKPIRPWQWSPKLVDPDYRELAATAAFIYPLWHGAGNALDLVTKTELALETGASWTSDVGGIGSITSSTTAGHFGNIVSQPIITSDGSGTGDFTIMAVATPVSEARIDYMISQRIHSGSFNQFGLVANASSIAPTISAGSIVFGTYAGALSEVTSGFRVDGFTHSFLGRRSGTNHSIWADGEKRVETSLTVRDVHVAGQSFRLGNAAALGNDWALKQPLHMAVGWNRALTDAECYLMTTMPWGLITRRAMRRVGAIIIPGSPVWIPRLIEG